MKHAQGNVGRAKLTTRLVNLELRFQWVIEKAGKERGMVDAIGIEPMTHPCEGMVFEIALTNIVQFQSPVF